MCWSPLCQLVFKTVLCTDQIITWGIWGSAPGHDSLKKLSFRKPHKETGPIRSNNHVMQCFTAPIPVTVHKDHGWAAELCLALMFTWSQYFALIQYCTKQSLVIGSVSYEIFSVCKISISASCVHYFFDLRVSTQFCYKLLLSQSLWVPGTQGTH